MKHQITITLLLLLILPLQAHAAYTPSELQSDLRNIASYFPGHVGISFISDRGDTLSINPNAPFPLMSVMKFHQALAICASPDRHLLDSTITISPDELNPNTYSPMLKTHPDGGRLSIRQLLDFSLVQSDNNASNILYNRLLGVSQVNLFAHNLIQVSDTDAAFQICFSEESMGRDVAKARQNYTTPLAAAELMSAFYELRHSSPNYRHLWKTMSHCQTGQNRIPRYLTDRRITIVHKTGTGGTLPDGTVFSVNDVACILLPNGRHYFLSVFIADAHCDMSVCEEFIANVSQIIYQYITEQSTSGH